MTAQFPISERTRMRRKARRATYDKATIHAILDEALVASVAVAIDGRPQVQPMIHVRVGDEIILHGLEGNRLLTAIAGGAEACINVMLLDALVLARRIEDHSMHYRSATVYGRGTDVGDEDEKARLMAQVFESLLRSGRMADLPPLPPGYLKGTKVVRVSIDEAVGKVNDAVDTGAGGDGIWSGLLPVSLAFGPPAPDARTAAEGIAVPAGVAAYRRS